MPSPFPGIDSYLEAPDLWPEVHHRLISAIALALASQLSSGDRPLSIILNPNPHALCSLAESCSEELFPSSELEEVN